MNLSTEIPEMELDRSQLKRVLVNLFDNAVAAMAGEGLVEVSTFRDSERGVFSLAVSDGGQGIHPRVADQLFEPYFSTKQGGTGLGLAIVQRIISDHGAFVRVAENQPRGTQFIIEFPESLVVKRRRPTDSNSDVASHRPPSEEATQSWS